MAETERYSVVWQQCGTGNQIAERFGRSPKTIKTHMRNINHKLGTSSKAELRLFAVKHGLSIAPPEDRVAQRHP